MGLPETFKALSSPVRRDILIMLKEGRMSAGEIGEHFDMTGATMSHHLSQLKKAGLVFETKVKNFIYYELNTTVFEELMLWFSQFRGGDNDEGI
ncbi:MAG: autorepressor SdpR family transcription factor [Emergencia sp.]